MKINGALAESYRDMVAAILPSLLIIRGKRGGGAGVVWAGGTLLTNAHVIGRGPVTVVTEDERELEAAVLKRDAEVDLALLSLRVDDLPALARSADPPRIGELVFAVGHPWGRRNSVSRGVVSALISGRTRAGRELALVRTDARLAPGNSGGPLVNARGELVGINAMVLGGDQGISLPLSVIRAFAGE